MLAAGKTHREIGEKLGLSIATICKYARKLPPQVSDGPAATRCPKPTDRQYLPCQIDTPGQWLILGDVHVPHHDRGTVEEAVRWAKANRAKGVILNGDLLDSHEISEHDKDPTAARYVDEIEIGKSLVGWIRGQLPKARLVFKAGNHEDRLERYIWRRAPAIWGLEGLNLQSLLHLDQHGIEYVGDKRVIRLGKLNVIHGHEYRGGVATAVNPARGVYLKARSVVLCGHWHRTSEHHERDIRGRPEAAWSVGCACSLAPQWMPLNQWNNGWASVEVHANGHFEVMNRRRYE